MTISQQDRDFWVNSSVTRHYFSQLKAIEATLKDNLSGVSIGEFTAERYFQLQGMLKGIQLAIDEEVNIEE
jgi:hypothetical protein